MYKVQKEDYGRFKSEKKFENIYSSRFIPIFDYLCQNYIFWLQYCYLHIIFSSLSLNINIVL